MVLDYNIWKEKFERIFATDIQTFGEEGKTMFDITICNNDV